MQWQQLKNINPKTDALLLLYATGSGTVRFAIRDQDDALKIATGYSKGQLEDVLLITPYEVFKERHGDKMLWCYFKDPYEN